ncbi:MAG: iron ABC transporter substrate-binding protein [Rhodospirillales bacterium]|nr:iron ABC transporter substrate-binding protein [Rhodospirillales bacterium]
MKLLNKTLRTIAAGAIALAAFAPQVKAQTAGEGILVYNAQHDNLTRDWAAGFTKETGIKVTIRKGSDMDMANQLVLEGNRTPADVFLTENSPAMVLVAKAGLFEPVAKDVLALVPNQYSPADGSWVGIAARSTVFVYNKNKLKPDQLPKSMAELASPAWKGRWAASPSGADFQAIAGAYLTLKGEAATADWLKAMKTNAVIVRGNGNAMKAANVGEVDGALIYHYYYFNDQAKTGENSRNIASHYFRNRDPGAFVSVSGGGVLASSKRKTEAMAFLRWIAGKGGQKVLRDGDSFEYAVGTGEASHPKLEPLARLEAPAVAPSQLDNKKVTDLMTAAGLL